MFQNRFASAEKAYFSQQKKEREKEKERVTSDEITR